MMWLMREGRQCGGGGQLEAGYCLYNEPNSLGTVHTISISVLASVLAIITIGRQQTSTAELVEL